EDSYDAILLGYGRCNDGVAGLQARAVPLVIPRAHDCITLFFGSAQAYERYFQDNPGTFFRTTGWTERDNPVPGAFGRPAGSMSASTQLSGPTRPAALSSEQTVLGRLGMDLSYEQYVERYGKDNADYIIGELSRWEKNYKGIVYIDLGMPPDEDYAQRARREARQRGLQFHRVAGNLRLIRALINGQWDPKEFLVVPPGHSIAGENDGEIIISVKSCK
ncbi:MAG: DUF1638 domain-containing protein, partial [Sedimentisphaerales bacterium]|nr:DUF1638 domain-containing protein [Sedimentisphaerales bacterium]